MSDGYESIGELGRAFNEFRRVHERAHDEISDDAKWLRRFLIGSLGTVVVTSIGSSLWAVLRG